MPAAKCNRRRIAGTSCLLRWAVLPTILAALIAHSSACRRAGRRRTLRKQDSPAVRRALPKMSRRRKAMVWLAARFARGRSDRRRQRPGGRCRQAGRKRAGAGASPIRRRRADAAAQRGKAARPPNKSRPSSNGSNWALRGRNRQRRTMNAKEKLRREHWAFQPVKHVDPPVVNDPSRVDNSDRSVCHCKAGRGRIAAFARSRSPHAHSPCDVRPHRLAADAGRRSPSSSTIPVPMPTNA